MKNVTKWARRAGSAASRPWRWYVSQYKGRPWWRRALTAAATVAVGVPLLCAAIQLNFLWLFGKSPSLAEIRNPRTMQASEIYSADGTLLGKFFTQNRSPVSYEEVNPVFWKALVSVEDERFYSHHGVDLQGIAAAAKDAFKGEARGASTITQQLVKNMFRMRTDYSSGLLGRIPGMRMAVMKAKEMILAVELEMTCSKKDILRMYANTVDFGSNAFGIKTAAKTYFDTTPARLKPEEAAVLVGMLKATTTYNPRINPRNALARRNLVLDCMYQHGHLTEAEAEALKQRPIDLHFSVENAYDGRALHFRDAVADYIREHCPELDPYSDGLKIYTTLDSRMQRYAEEAVAEQMRTLQKTFDAHWRGLGEPWRDERGNIIPGFIEKIARRSDYYRQLTAKFPEQPDSVDHYMNLPHKVHLFDYDGGHDEIISTMDSIRYMVRFLHTGFVAMEPQTGHVKAWVGDVDFKTWKYDKVRAMRQPGSTFKLFVYATAMKQGLTPSDTRKDGYIEMKVYDKRKQEEVVWRPHNANGNYSNALLPLRSAFSQSVNTIAVALGQECGIDNVVETARDMGIRSPLEATPSLPLGSSDVNLLELVNAYATVAADGEHTEPVLVTRIEDARGRTVYEARPERRKALPYVSAFYLQKMLEAATTDAGATAQSLRAQIYMGPWARTIDMGGKTGTSNNHSDAWFVGVTPALVGGAWVGGEYRSIHFRTGRLGQGSKTALPIFGLFMHKVLSDPAFRKYLVRYQPKQDIPAANYSNSLYIAEPVDSFATDSTEIGAEGLMDDAGGASSAAETGAMPSEEENIFE